MHGSKNVKFKSDICRFTTHLSVFHTLSEEMKREKLHNKYGICQRNLGNSYTFCSHTKAHNDE